MIHTCPNCPKCDRALSKNGSNLSGTQRWRCKCGYSMSDSPHKQGRPLKWDEAMTSAERQAEHRLRQDEKKSIENKGEELKMFKVGIVGYSDQKFNTERASTLIKRAFDRILSDDEVAIVSGLTAIDSRTSNNSSNAPIAFELLPQSNILSICSS